MSKGYRNIDDSVREEYLEWLMTPPGEREPATKQDVAAMLGVAVSTLWRWEKEPDFQEELRQLKAKWGVRFHGEILGRLMKIVQEGADSSAIQASKVLLAHIDVSGGAESSEDDLGLEELKAIRSALNADGYVTKSE